MMKRCPVVGTKTAVTVTSDSGTPDIRAIEERKAQTKARLSARLRGSLPAVMRTCTTTWLAPLPPDLVAVLLMVAEPVAVEGAVLLMVAEPVADGEAVSLMVVVLVADEMAEGAVSLMVAVPVADEGVRFTPSTWT